MATKRKALTLDAFLPSPAKKLAARTIANTTAMIDRTRVEEKVGIVQREFYPPELSNERCAMYVSGALPRPMQLLERAISETADSRASIAIGEAVVHWYKRDLRLYDNKALYMASSLARQHNVPLICMFIVSPQDYQAHLTSPCRVDFELRTLRSLKKDLAELNIPLHVGTLENRKEISGHIIDLCTKWGSRHIFCNIEYEVDELRRETLLTRKCLEKGISFTAVHDDVIVAPGRLMSGAGKPYAVYSPWYRAWVAHLHGNPELLEAFERPQANPMSALDKYKELFLKDIPSAPRNKTLTPGVRRNHWA